LGQLPKEVPDIIQTSGTTQEQMQTVEAIMGEPTKTVLVPLEIPFMFPRRRKRRVQRERQGGWFRKFNPMTTPGQAVKNIVGLPTPKRQKGGRDSTSPNLARSKKRKDKVRRFKVF
jgi:hypothetical protein